MFFFFRGCKLKHTHSHNSLCHSGQHGGPQRVQQDLALQQHEVQQRGTVLRPQIHQQRAVVGPADGGEGRGQNRGMSSGRERKQKTERRGKGKIGMKGKGEKETKAGKMFFI